MMSQRPDEVDGVERGSRRCCSGVGERWRRTMARSDELLVIVVVMQVGSGHGGLARAGVRRGNSGDQGAT